MAEITSPVKVEKPSASDLLASLEAHNATFEALLALIPPKYYISSEYNDDIPGEGQEQRGGFGSGKKYQKHSKKVKGVDDARKRERRREKLDPDNQKSIIELKNEQSQHNEMHAPKVKSQNKSRQAKGDSGVDIDVEFSDDEEHNENENISEDEKQEGRASGETTLTPMPPPTGIVALREKLHARMTMLRQGRGRNSGPNPGSGGDEGVATGGREALLEERRARRALMRERRRKETKERIRKGKMGEGSNQIKDDNKEDGKTKSKDKQKQKDQDAGRSHQPQPELFVPDTHASVSFPVHSSPKGKSKSKSKNPTQALTALTSHLEHLSTLPDSERAEIEARERWEKAETRMEGGKVYDDVARLKGAIKRREAAKEKSTKAWEGRKQQLVQAMAARQQKRSDNIAMRNERRKSKDKHSSTKTGGTKSLAGVKGKAGKSRPGFEGKSFGKTKVKTKGKS